MASVSQCAIQGALGLACLLVPRAAFAQEPHVDQNGPPSVDASPVGDHGFMLDVWLGGGRSAALKETVRWGAGVGVTGIYHYRWLELGVGYRVEAAVFSYVSQVPGVLAGVKTDPYPWLRFELLAEGDAYIVSDVGDELFSTVVSGETGAVRPYLGGRWGMSLLLGDPHQFLLGWWVNAGEATGQVTMHPVVQSCFLGCSTETETFTLGGPSWSMGLRIGGEIPM